MSENWYRIESNGKYLPRGIFNDNLVKKGKVWSLVGLRNYLSARAHAEYDGSRLTSIEDYEIVEYVLTPIKRVTVKDFVNNGFNWIG